MSQERDATAIGAAAFYCRNLGAQYYGTGTPSIESRAGVSDHAMRGSNHVLRREIVSCDSNWSAESSNGNVMASS